MKFELTFVAEKETLNTVRYKEHSADARAKPLVGAIYLQKEAVKALKNPGVLKVTIEAEGD